MLEVVPVVLLVELIQWNPLIGQVVMYHVVVLVLVVVVIVIEFVVVDYMVIELVV